MLMTPGLRPNGEGLPVEVPRGPNSVEARPAKPPSANFVKIPFVWFFASACVMNGMATGRGRNEASLYNHVRAWLDSSI